MRVALLCLALVACSDAPDRPDAGRSLDAGESPDAGESLDAGCVDACRQTTLEVTLSGETRPFTRAQFGRTSPQMSSSGEWELYVEAYAGGSVECPDQGSPTPDRTLVLSGIRVPDEQMSEQTKEDGLFAAFFDFRGDLTDEPFIRAESIVLTPHAYAGEELVGFHLDAKLPGGQVEGQVFATYCPSLDEL